MFIIPSKSAVSNPIEVQQTHLARPMDHPITSSTAGQANLANTNKIHSTPEAHQVTSLMENLQSLPPRPTNLVEQWINVTPLGYAIQDWTPAIAGRPSVLLVAPAALFSEHYPVDLAIHHSRKAERPAHMFGYLLGESMDEDVDKESGCDDAGIETDGDEESMDGEIDDEEEENETEGGFDDGSEMEQCSEAGGFVRRI